MSGYDANNLVSGRLRLGKETLATLQGHWDADMTLTSKKTGDTEKLWTVSQTVKVRSLRAAPAVSGVRMWSPLIILFNKIILIVLFLRRFTAIRMLLMSNDRTER